MTPITAALIILALPLLAFVVIVFLTRRAAALSSFIAIGAISVSAILALAVVFPATLAGNHYAFDVDWLVLVPPGSTQSPGSGEGVLRLGIGIDPLTALMLVVVTSVSLLVQVYSRGYMVERGQRDPGYSRFFAYLSLFTFSMLGLVLANNLLFLFMSWELVGLSSYLLIGFWYQKPEAWIAAKKAFLTTRVGDVGFLIGLIVLWNAGGTLSIEELIRQAETHAGNLFAASLLGQPVLFWACVCLFAGAVGKSGQFPLHVWLPDAMEGPTPVSALIHAATMVAAGVYLVARTYPFFEAVPQALALVAVIGGFTAIFAATMGLVNNDIKRVLAFSTVSQLGYMMLGLGAGSLAAGMFHLFTHAFFKALLFLAAGSAIHATETNDIREMGGLRRAMPITWATMAIGALSLIGFPFFSGFWSKDEILATTAIGGGPILLLFAVVTVFLTAFYTFRMFFLAFHGRYRGHHHPHESDGWMTLPLIVLAIPSLLVGLWGSPVMDYGFQRFLEGAEFHAPEINLTLAVVSSVLAIAGIVVAWMAYGARDFVAEPLARLGAAYRVLLHRYYIDELYMWIIDKLVLVPAAALTVFDRNGLDALVNGIGQTFREAGSGLRTMQTGRVQTYGLVLFAGLAVIAFALVLPMIFGLFRPL